MRRAIIVVLSATVAVVALGTAVVATSGGSSTVTRARLERALTTAFANLYVDQARIRGRDEVTADSLRTKAMCDKGGARSADVGPGGDWVCLMSWADPEVPMPAEGYGKFELNVHSNDCYTAGGPSKLTGFLTMTDAHGRVVTNPLFEFDGCFDPNGDNSPTGVEFPSLLSITSTTVRPDAQGSVGLQVSCGTGHLGCVGSVTARAGGVRLGTMPFDLKEESTATLPTPEPVPSGAKQVTFLVRSTTGVASSSPMTLPIQP